MSGYVNSPEQQVRISAGTAFKIGFFGALGAVCLSIVVSILLAILGAILGVIFGVSLWSLYGG